MGNEGEKNVFRICNGYQTQNGYHHKVIWGKIGVPGARSLGLYTRKIAQFA